MDLTAAARLDPFESLNAEQRLAVGHGLGDDHGDTRPLLIIAGAGSGKTNTLAYRVANLMLHQADPQRLLLLTFSRRAAVEMERRVGGVLNRVLSQGASRQLPSLPWSGTFHSMGARLLRDYAGRIGLDESFTIHDRGDSEDLLGLVRHDLGLSQTHNQNQNFCRFTRRNCWPITNAVDHPPHQMSQPLRCRLILHVTKNQPSHAESRTLRLFKHIV